MADIDDKIVKQVDFYFSDSNYPKDKFLRNKEKENPDGYIPISVLTSFNRLKEITTDTTIIANALKKSSVVVVNADATMVKRKDPLPADDTSLPRSIYSKGWPQSTTIEQVSTFFAPYGKVLSVRLRRMKPSGEFKGSLVAEFASEEEAKAALSAAPQLDGNTLTYQTKEAWSQDKREAYQKKKASKKAKEGENDVEKSGKRKEPEEDGGEEYTKGVIISFKGVGPQKREDLKPVFSEFGDVLFVDFMANAADGYIRFAKPEEAKKALEELTVAKREFGGQVPTMSILEGEEEKTYWERVEEMKAKGKEKSRGRGRGRGRGGRGGGRGGKFKKQKTS